MELKALLRSVVRAFKGVKPSMTPEQPTHPIHELPPEIITTIFVFVHEDRDNVVGGTSPLQHLRAVCKDWKATVEGHPQLKRYFNTIHLKPSTIREDLPFVERCLCEKASLANAMRVDEKDAAAEMVTLCISCAGGEDSNLEPFFTLKGLDAVSRIELGSSVTPWPYENSHPLFSQLRNEHRRYHSGNISQSLPHPFLDKVCYLSISITCRLETFENINSLQQLDTLVLPWLNIPSTFNVNGPLIVLPRVRRVAVSTCLLPDGVGAIFDCPALEYLECHNSSIALFSPQSVPSIRTFRHEGPQTPLLEGWITQLSDTLQRIEFVTTQNIGASLSRKVEQVYLQHMSCNGSEWIESCQVKRVELHDAEVCDLNALDGIDVVHRREPVMGLIRRKWNIDPDEL